jgi:hypothetical protein
MGDHLKEWLKKNKEENSKALQKLQFGRRTDPNLNQEEPVPSTSGVNARVQRENEELIHQNTVSNQKVTNPSDIVFENNSLKLTVSRAAHIQEKKFRVKNSCFLIQVLIIRLSSNFRQRYSHPASFVKLPLSPLGALPTVGLFFQIFIKPPRPVLFAATPASFCDSKTNCFHSGLFLQTVLSPRPLFAIIQPASLAAIPTFLSILPGLFCETFSIFASKESFFYSNVKKQEFRNFFCSVARSYVSSNCYFKNEDQNAITK